MCCIVNFNVAFLWFEKLLCCMYLVDSIIKVEVVNDFGKQCCVLIVKNSKYGQGHFTTKCS